MKRNLIILLQVVAMLIGIGAFVFLLVEPNFEGRNTNATLFAIYFKDPFLAFAYIASIAFFSGLYHIYKILGFARQNKFTSAAALKALKKLKNCAVICVGFIVAGVILLLTGQTDDGPPVLLLGTVAILGAVLVAVFADKSAVKIDNMLRQTSVNRN